MCVSRTGRCAWPCPWRVGGIPIRDLIDSTCRATVRCKTVAENALVPRWLQDVATCLLANKLRLRAPLPVPLAHAKTLGPVRETAHTPPSSFTRIRLGLSLIVRHADITHHTVHSAQRRPAPLRAGVFSRSALLPAGLVAPLRLPPSPHTCMRCIGRPAQPVS